MSDRDRVLVAYGTKHGATAAIGEVIAKSLSSAVLEVDAQRARHVRSLDSYRAVVVGSAVYAGRQRWDAMRSAPSRRGRLPVPWRTSATSGVARVTQVTRETMHPAILRLKSAGLLERRARNQRVVLLRPTQQGREALRAATGRIRVAERAGFAGMSEQDEAIVRAWLARLAAVTTRRGHTDADRKGEAMNETIGRCRVSRDCASDRADRIAALVAVGVPAVALPVVVRVRMPLSVLTVRGLA